MDPLGRYLLAHVDGVDSRARHRARHEPASSARSPPRGATTCPSSRPTAASSLAQGNDVIIVDGDVAPRRRRACAAAPPTSGIPFRWTGFRPRDATLDQPVDRSPADAGQPTPRARDSTRRQHARTGHPPPAAPPRDTAARRADRVHRVVRRAARRRQGARARAQIHVGNENARVVTASRDGSTIYRVVLGPYPTRDEAERDRPRIEAVLLGLRGRSVSATRTGLDGGGTAARRDARRVITPSSSSASIRSRRRDVALGIARVAGERSTRRGRRPPRRGAAASGARARRRSARPRRQLPLRRLAQPHRVSGAGRGRAVRHAERHRADRLRRAVREPAVAAAGRGIPRGRRAADPRRAGRRSAPATSSSTRPTARCSSATTCRAELPVAQSLAWVRPRKHAPMALAAEPERAGGHACRRTPIEREPRAAASGATGEEPARAECARARDAARWSVLASGSLERPVRRERQAVAWRAANIPAAASATGGALQSDSATASLSARRETASLRDSAMRARPHVAVTVGLLSGAARQSNRGDSARRPRSPCCCENTNDQVGRYLGSHTALRRPCRRRRYALEPANPLLQAGGGAFHDARRRRVAARASCARSSVLAAGIRQRRPSCRTPSSWTPTSPPPRFGRA